MELTDMRAIVAKHVKRMVKRLHNKVPTKHNPGTDAALPGLHRHLHKMNEREDAFLTTTFIPIVTTMRLTGSSGKVEKRHQTT